MSSIATQAFAAALEAGTTSSVARVEEALERIEGDDWTAFVEVTAERARHEARAREQRRPQLLVDLLSARQERPPRGRRPAGAGA